jgi:hypothetical protein
MLNNKVYDILKWIAIIVLPALATLIKVVFAAWNLPYADPIATTVTAVATFLGAILMVSSVQYKKDIQ